MTRKIVFGLVVFLLILSIFTSAQTSSALIKLQETSRQKGQINRIELNRVYEDEFTEDTLKWGAYYMWPYIVKVDSPKTLTVRVQSDFQAGEDPKLTVTLTQRSSFSKVFSNWSRKTGYSSSLSQQLTKPGEYMLYISPNEKKRIGTYRFVVAEGEDAAATQIMAAVGMGTGGAAAGASTVAAASFKEGKPANYPVLPDHPEVHAVRAAYEEFTGATFKPAQTRTAAQLDEGQKQRRLILRSGIWDWFR